MFVKIIFIAICFIIPLVIVFFKHKWKLIKLVSPVVWCYIIGIFLGNTNIITVPNQLAENISQISVLVAIPLLLVSTNLQQLRLQAQKGLIAFFAMVLAVFVSSLSVGLLFTGMPNIELITGMLCGIFSGGTPNMASVYLALNVPSDLYISVSTVQIAIGGIYLLLLTTVLKPFFNTFLIPISPILKTINTPENLDISYKMLAIGMLKSLLLSLLIVAISGGLMWVVFEQLNVIALIVSLTSLSFLFSLSPRIRNTPFSFEMGDYLMLVFSIAIGSLANLSSIYNSGFQLVIITALIMFIAVVLHLVFCWLFKIDVKTVIITSAAAFYGPAFIGQIAQAIGARHLVALGIGCGIVGYAMGTYLGLAVAEIIKQLVLP